MMSSEQYDRLLGSITALQVAVAALTKLLPSAEKEALLGRMSDLMAQADSTKQARHYAAGLAETAGFIVKQGRLP